MSSSRLAKKPADKNLSSSFSTSRSSPRRSRPKPFITDPPETPLAALSNRRHAADSEFRSTPPPLNTDRKRQDEKPKRSPPGTQGLAASGGSLGGSATNRRPRPPSSRKPSAGSRIYSPPPYESPLGVRVGKQKRRKKREKGEEESKSDQSSNESDDTVVEPGYASLFATMSKSPEQEKSPTEPPEIRLLSGPPKKDPLLTTGILGDFSEPTGELQRKESTEAIMGDGYSKRVFDEVFSQYDIGLTGTGTAGTGTMFLHRFLPFMRDLETKIGVDHGDIIKVDLEDNIHKNIATIEEQSFRDSGIRNRTITADQVKGFFRDLRGTGLLDEIIKQRSRQTSFEESGNEEESKEASAEFVSVGEAATRPRTPIKTPLKLAWEKTQQSALSGSFSREVSGRSLFSSPALAQSTPKERLFPTSPISPLFPKDVVRDESDEEMESELRRVPDNWTYDRLAQESDVDPIQSILDLVDLAHEYEVALQKRKGRLARRSLALKNALKDREEADQKCIDTETEYRTLEKEYSKVSAENDKLKGANQVLEVQIKRIGQEMETTDEAKHQERIAAQKTRDTLRETEKQLGMVRKNFKEANVAIDELKIQLKNKDTAYKKANTELQECRKHREELTKERDQLSQETIENAELINELEEQSTQMKQDFEQREASFAGTSPAKGKGAPGHGLRRTPTDTSLGGVLENLSFMPSPSDVSETPTPQVSPEKRPYSSPSRSELPARKSISPEKPATSASQVVSAEDLPSSDEEGIPESPTRRRSAVRKPSHSPSRSHTPAGTTKATTTADPKLAETQEIKEAEEDEETDPLLRFYNRLAEYIGLFPLKGDVSSEEYGYSLVKYTAVDLEFTREQFEAVVKRVFKGVYGAASEEDKMFFMPHDDPIISCLEEYRKRNDISKDHFGIALVRAAYEECKINYNPFQGVIKSGLTDEDYGKFAQALIECCGKMNRNINETILGLGLVEVAIGSYGFDCDACKGFDFEELIRTQDPLIFQAALEEFRKLEGISKDQFGIGLVRVAYEEFDLKHKSLESAISASTPIEAAAYEKLVQFLQIYCVDSGFSVPVFRVAIVDAAIKSYGFNLKGLTASDLSDYSEAERKEDAMAGVGLRADDLLKRLSRDQKEGEVQGKREEAEMYLSLVLKEAMQPRGGKGAEAIAITGGDAPPGTDLQVKMFAPREEPARPAPRFSTAPGIFGGEPGEGRTVPGPAAGGSGALFGSGGPAPGQATTAAGTAKGTATATTQSTPPVTPKKDKDKGVATTAPSGSKPAEGGGPKPEPKPKPKPATAAKTKPRDPLSREIWYFRPGVGTQTTLSMPPGAEDIWAGSRAESRWQAAVAMGDVLSSKDFDPEKPQASYVQYADVGTDTQDLPIDAERELAEARTDATRRLVEQKLAILNTNPDTGGPGYGPDYGPYNWGKIIAKVTGDQLATQLRLEAEAQRRNNAPPEEPRGPPEGEDKNKTKDAQPHILPRDHALEERIIYPFEAKVHLIKLLSKTRLSQEDCNFVTNFIAVHHASHENAFILTTIFRLSTAVERGLRRLKSDEFGIRRGWGSELLKPVKIHNPFLAPLSAMAAMWWEVCTRADRADYEAASARGVITEIEDEPAPTDDVHPPLPPEPVFRSEDPKAAASVQLPPEQPGELVTTGPEPAPLLGEEGRSPPPPHTHPRPRRSTRQAPTGRAATLLHVGPKPDWTWSALSGLLFVVLIILVLHNLWFYWTVQRELWGFEEVNYVGVGANRWKACGEGFGWEKRGFRAWVEGYFGAGEGIVAG